MPYEGEYAGYRSVRRLVGADAVQQLLKRAKVAPPNASQESPSPVPAPVPSTPAPDFVVGIDGSYNEVPVRNGYPGAHVGYCTVASVLINLKLIDQLDDERPVDPQLFRKTEEAATVDAQLCVLGQRNEPSPAALPETLAFQRTVGRGNIENRIVQLSAYLKEQIKSKIPNAVFVTPISPELSGGIVIINLPGKEIHEVTDNLYHNYGIAAAPSGGIRLSPHVYNSLKDIDYVVKSIGEVGK